MPLLLSLLTSAAPPRVAIIGGGIGAASTAYHLSHRLPGVETVVFERDERLGGRLQHLWQDGVKLELGGTFFNRVLNPHIAELIEAVGARTAPMLPPLMAQDFYIVNGTGTILRLRKSHELVDLAAITARFAVPFADTLVASREFSGALKKTLARIGAGTTFRSLSTLLGWDGLDRFSGVNASTLLHDRFVSNEFLETVISAITNVIYTQGVGTAAFIALSCVSMFSEYSFPASSVEGNDLLVRDLLLKTNTSALLGANVVSVARAAHGTGFELSYTQQANSSAERFDAVVLAAPLEVASLAFPGLSLDPTAALRRHYVGVHVTCITAGAINGTFFGVEEMPATSTIISPSSSTLPCGLHFVWRVGDSNSTAGHGVYLLHSKEVVGPEVVAAAFVDVYTVTRHHWPAAYPEEKPTASDVERQPVVLTPTGGLYYLNTIESIASSMETSALAGNNAAQLLARWWADRE